MEKIEAHGIPVSAFYEPDQNLALTAICLEATERACKLTSSLPLAFKEHNKKEHKQIHLSTILNQ